MTGLRSVIANQEFRRLDLALVTATGFFTALLLLLAPIKIAAGVILALIGAIIILSSAMAGLLLVVLLVPFGLLSAQISGIQGISAAEIVLVLTIAVVLARVFALGSGRLRLPAVAIGPVALILVMLLSTSQAIAIGPAVKEILRWLEVAVAIVVAMAAVRDQISLQWLLIIQALAIAAQAMVGIYQFFTQTGPPSFIIGPFLRAYGTFGQPNPYAGYLVVAGLPLVFWSVSKIWRWLVGSEKLAIWELFVVVASAGAGLGLLMSLSRGAWLGIAAGALVAAVVLQRRLGNVLRLGLGAGLLAGLTLVLELVPEFILRRFEPVLAYFRWFDPAGVVPNAENWAIVERMAHWDAAWRMFLDHPLLGVGPGAYVVEYEHYAIMPWWTDPLGHAHNIYLHMLAEVGIIGLLIYLAMVILWFAASWTFVHASLTGQARRWLPLQAGVLAMLTALSVHNFFDNLYVQGINIQVAIWVGIAARLYAMTQSSQDKAIPSTHQKTG